MNGGCEGSLPSFPITLRRMVDMLPNSLKAALKLARSRALWETNTRLEYNSQLLGRMASWQVRAQEVISTLSDVEFKVTSQWGEDGIIDWLVERASIPVAAQSFVEFGVETYCESNTRFLLQNRNWRGLILDGSPAVLEAIKRGELSWRHDLSAVSAFITRENINGLIGSAGFRGTVGLMSIDVDGNDYWIWEVIDVIDPIIVICEYNAVFGDMYAVSVPYQSDFNCAVAHHSCLYFGASVRALCLLGVRKGYRFVGTNSAGGNAFFVREDYAKQFVDGSLREIREFPSRSRSSRDQSGNLNYIGGLQRLAAISSMTVVNVESGETVKLADLKEPYSDAWREAISGIPSSAQ
jgi:hypothetical protein